MQMTYQLQDLDCANCAQKMEDAIRKIDGVQDVQVSFLLQKLILTADEDRLSDILKKAQKACRKIEPDCKILI